MSVVRLSLLIGVWWAISASCEAAPRVAVVPLQIQQIDPVPEANKAIDDGDFNPGLGLFALAMLIAFLFLAAVCIILAVLTVAAAIGIAVAGTALVGVGIVTMSALVGIVSRQLSAGVRAFFVQIGGIVGIPCGIAISTAAVWLLDLGVTWKWSTLAGAVVGLSAGIVGAFAFNFVWTSAVQRILAGSNRVMTANDQEKAKSLKVLD